MSGEMAQVHIINSSLCSHSRLRSRMGKADEVSLLWSLRHCLMNATQAVTIA